MPKKLCALSGFCVELPQVFVKRPSLQGAPEVVEAFERLRHLVLTGATTLKRMSSLDIPGCALNELLQLVYYLTHCSYAIGMLHLLHVVGQLLGRWHLASLQPPTHLNVLCRSQSRNTSFVTLAM